MSIKPYLLVMLITFGGWRAVGSPILAYNPAQIAGARSDGAYTVGSLFQVDQAGLQITHLGIQDVDAAGDAQDPDGADGLTGFADDDGFYRDTFGGGAGLSVGLWTADGATLLASVVVPSTAPVSGSYRYVQLASPVSLSSGTRYLIGAAVGGGIEWFLDGTTSPFSSNSGFTLVRNVFAPGGTLTAPLSDGGGNIGRWGPANALVVPEPATASLLVAGLVGLARVRRIK